MLEIEVLNLIYKVFWFYNIIYTFKYWEGIEHKLFNLFVPYASVYDLIMKLGKF